MSINSLADDNIYTISKYLQWGDLRNFAYTCKRIYHILQSTDSRKACWLEFLLKEFECIHAAYFQNVPTLLAADYPNASRILEAGRNSDGFLPDYEIAGKDCIGQNSIKYFLKEAQTNYPKNPAMIQNLQKLLQQYKKAEKKIHEIKSADIFPLNSFPKKMSKSIFVIGILFTIFCISIDKRSKK